MKPVPVLAINRLGPDSLYRNGQPLLPASRVATSLLAPAHEGFATFTADFSSIEYLSLNDPALWRERAVWHLKDSGVQRIVAPNERFLRLAAELREEFDIPGISVREANIFTDKVLMKRALAGGRVRVPQFISLDEADDITSFPFFPAVLKRTDFSGGRGVYTVSTRNEAVAVYQQHRSDGEFEIEEFVDGEMYHCDSVVMDGVIRFATVSRYLAKPGDFHAGGVGGSVLIEESDLQRSILELNAETLHTLGLRDGVTHLELFRTSADELVFCEVAARPGGGGIVEYILSAHGIDLKQVALWLDAGLGIPTGRMTSATSGTFGCIGLYPSSSVRKLPDPAFLQNLGVVDVETMHSRGEFEPEHCTDYVVLFQLRGDNPRDFDDRAQALCARLGVSQELTLADHGS